MNHANPCLMVQVSDKEFRRPFGIRSQELGPGILMNKSHEVILRLAACNDDSQDSRRQTSYIPIVHLSRKY